MTAMVQQVQTRFLRLSAGLRAALSITAALLITHWWVFSYVPNHFFRSGPLLPRPAGLARRRRRRLLLVPPPRLAPHPRAPGRHDARPHRRRPDWFFIVAGQIVLGIFANFGHSPFAHSPRWLATNLLFAGSILVGIETSRAALLRALGRYGLTLALLLTTLALAAVNLPQAMFLKHGLAAQATFWGSVYIPMAATGLVAGFFVMYGGLRAGLLVAAPIMAFQYFSPILPIADWPLTALVGVGAPAVGLWVAEGLFEEDPEEEDDGSFIRLPSLSWTVTMTLALAIFWFSFGFFGHKPVFVPSGSMEPNINHADVVIIGHVDPDKVQVGDVVLYQMVDGPRVLHRVIAIGKGEDGQRTFTFKGDANGDADGTPVVDKQLLGRFELRIPKAGWLPIKFQQELSKLL